MSTPVPIDFGAGQASGLDQLSGAQPALINLLVDAAGAIRYRPGIGVWADFPAVIPNASPVIGMSVFGRYLVYVTEDRKLWAWLGAGNVIPLSDATAATQLDGSLRPVFTYDSQRIVIAGGGAAQKWEGVGLSSRLGGSPPAASHIAYLAQRFVVNVYDNTGITFWSPQGVGNHEIWSTANFGVGFAEAETAPDPVVALYATTGEYFAFGSTTLNVFQPDPTTQFSLSAAIALGCGAPYSPIDLDGTFVWLDQHRRIVRSDGRSQDVLSSPGMARDLEKFVTISDCWGTRTHMGSFDILLWVFPTEGRAIYYENTTQKWGEWRSNSPTGEWAPWVAQSHYFWADRNLDLVGLSDGSIAILTFDAFDDNGQPMRALSRTGFDAAGTLTRKLCERAQLQMVRGATAPSAAAPTVELSYRDDLGAFRTAIQFSLGAGDYAPVVEKYALGMFRQRQWELRFSDAAEFILTAARASLQEVDN